LFSSSKNGALKHEKKRIEDEDEYDDAIGACRTHPPSGVKSKPSPPSGL
jgi:hypothetical protein